MPTIHRALCLVRGVFSSAVGIVDGGDPPPATFTWAPGEGTGRGVSVRQAIDGFALAGPHRGSWLGSAPLRLPSRPVVTVRPGRSTDDRDRSDSDSCGMARMPSPFR